MTDLAAHASPMTDTAPPAPVLVVIDRARAGARGEGPGWHVADATEPTVNVVDLGVTRGDGIFEAFGVSTAARRRWSRTSPASPARRRCSTFPSPTST